MYLCMYDGMMYVHMHACIRNKRGVTNLRRYKGRWIYEEEKVGNDVIIF